jgi:FMN phosphatase YigB (HAD superfamily)
MHHARWLFFDLGNTLISEEAAAESRIQQLVGSLKRYGRCYSVDDVRSAFVQASREFAPRLITRAIEKLTDDPECRKLIEAEARYPKELESPYEGAEQTLRALSSRYLIGVIANQSVGTEERLATWGLILLSHKIRHRVFVYLNGCKMWYLGRSFSGSGDRNGGRLE